MKILVIGDSCEDVFQYGVCERLSPEAPVPVFKPTKERKNGGMALNVLENINAMGIECEIITNITKPIKKRYVEENLNHTFIRVDSNDFIEPIELDVIDSINFRLYEAVVISDYNKGYLNELIIEKVLLKHPCVFIDSKKGFGDWVKNAFAIKINEKEFNANKEFLLNHYNGNLIVTLGKKGAMHNNSGKLFTIKDEQNVLDISGAGDTFLAALVVEYIKSHDICMAIEFANRCSSWVVTQKGVCVVNLSKL